MEKDEAKEEDNIIQNESSSWGIKLKRKRNPSIERTEEKIQGDSWGTKLETEKKKEGWGSSGEQSTSGGWGSGQSSGGGWGSGKRSGGGWGSGKRSGGGWGSGQRSGDGWGSKNTAQSNTGWGNQTLSDLKINSWWWLKMTAKIIEVTFHKMFEQFQLNQKSW